MGHLTNQGPALLPQSNPKKSHTAKPQGFKADLLHYSANDTLSEVV